MLLRMRLPISTLHHAGHPSGPEVRLNPLMSLDHFLEFISDLQDNSCATYCIMCFLPKFPCTAALL